MRSCFKIAITYEVNRIVVMSQSLHICTGGDAMCSILTPSLFFAKLEMAY